MESVLAFEIADTIMVSMRTQKETNQYNNVNESPMYDEDCFVYVHICYQPMMNH
jgi:hypothetical protein